MEREEAGVELDFNLTTRRKMIHNIVHFILCSTRVCSEPELTNRRVTAVICQSGLTLMFKSFLL